MKQAEFDQELSPEVREKMKKNLVYIGIFSVVMLFAGFTSGYIVSMGDAFWVKYNFPNAFYISTAIILLSSLTLYLGVKQAQKANNPALLKLILPLTFVLGVLFAVFQWVGYGQLVEQGAYLNSKIMVTNGRYGSFFEIKVNGDFLEIDGNDYKLKNKQVSDTQKKEISAFAAKLVKLEAKNKVQLSEYGTKYQLVYI